MLDEIDGGDLCTQIDLFENKLSAIEEKAHLLLSKAKNFESPHERLPDILSKFREITELFESGYYNKMIVGELEKNYMQINDMADKLSIEKQAKIPVLDIEKNDDLDLKDFEYI